jgi:chitobiase/beta-hexosaminidase-like protein/molybdenum-dependent oxidoreductase-like protein
MSRLFEYKNYGKIVTILTFFLLFLYGTTAFALTDFTLQWNEEYTEPDLVEYRIYYRTGALPYDNAGSPIIKLPADDELPGDPKIYQTTVLDLPDNAAFIAITAFDEEGLESDPTEVATANNKPVINLPLKINNETADPVYTNNLQVTVTVDATDPDVADYIEKYVILNTDANDPPADGSFAVVPNPPPFNATHTLEDADGPATVFAWVRDNRGGISDKASLNVVLDRVPPAAPAFNPGTGIYNSQRDVIATLAGDASTSYYTLDGSVPDNTDTLYTPGNQIAIDGNHGDVKTLKMASYDAAGNKSTVTSATYTFDKVSPVEPTFDIVTGTYNTQQNVTATLAGDAWRTYYTLDGSVPDNTDTLYTPGSQIAIDGNDGDIKILKMASYDTAGNKSTVLSTTYTFDKAAPVITITDPATGKYVAGSSYTIKGTENDGTGSGVATVEVSIDDGATWNGATIITTSWSYNANLAQGANDIKIRATDNLGNMEVYTGPTLTYYPPLTITVDAQNVTDGEIYVPNIAGNNTKTILVTGGSKDYATYTFNPAPSFGNLTGGAADNEKVFTANVGEQGDDNLTIQDPFNTTLYNATLTIHVVDFGITGDAGILKGQEAPYSVVGAIGNISWQITEGQAVSGTPVIDGANAKVTPLNSGTFKIKATDGTTGAFDEKTVEVYEPLQITDKPMENVYIEVGAHSQTYRVQGGDGSYTWTVKDKDGNEIISVVGGAEFSFIAPNSAGEYKVTVTDSLGLDSGDSFIVKVTMKLDADAYAMLEGDPANVLTITGVPVGTTFDVTLYNSDGPIIQYESGTTVIDNDDNDDYGSLSSTGIAGTSPFNYDPPAYISDDMTKSFTLEFIAGDEYLKSVGLEVLESPVFRVFPTKTYDGYIYDIDTSLSELSGVTVTIIWPEAYAEETTTGAEPGESEGYFKFEKPDTGATYWFSATKDGYETRPFTSIDLSQNNWIQLIAGEENAYIKGYITPFSTGDLINVSVINKDNDNLLAQTLSNDGNFRFDFAQDPGATGYTLTAYKPGYSGVTEIIDPLPKTNVEINMSALADNEINVVSGGASEPVTIAGQSVSLVQIPAGSINPDAPISGVITTVTVNYTTHDNEDSLYTSYSGDFLYEITLIPADAELLPGKFIIITLPFDLAKIGPLDFESGRVLIYKADTKGDLINGINFSTVNTKTDILSVDYIGIGNGVEGLVKFRVWSLSVFGFGAPVGGGTPTTPGGRGGGGGGCFIATAAYGSPFEGHVKILRKFRDVYLLPSGVGHAFVNAYYKYSPPVAGYISKHDNLRALVRFGLAPIVGMSYLALNTGPAQKILILMLILVFAAGGYCVIRRKIHGSWA